MYKSNLRICVCGHIFHQGTKCNQLISDNFTTHKTEEYVKCVCTNSVVAIDLSLQNIHVNKFGFVI